MSCSSFLPLLRIHVSSRCAVAVGKKRGRSWAGSRQETMGSASPPPGPTGFATGRSGDFTASKPIKAAPKPIATNDPQTMANRALTLVLQSRGVQRCFRADLADPSGHAHLRTQRYVQ